MPKLEFKYVSRFSCSAKELFSWHERPGAFERLNPPWEPVRVVHSDGHIKDGAKVTISVPIHPLLPFRTRWKLVHKDYVEGKQFKDILLSGPFKSWEHTHLTRDSSETFNQIPSTNDQIEAFSSLEDSLKIELPLSFISHIILAKFLSNKMDSVFHYRHAIMMRDIQAHSLVKRPLKVAVTGASGFVGSALIPLLTTGGHTVTKLVRNAEKKPDEIQWLPQVTDRFLSLSGYDALVHLAGDNIASGRWSSKKRLAIRQSRVETTGRLVENILKLPSPPKVVVMASGSGYYGDRGDELLTEASSKGRGFLADVVEDWEAALKPLEDRGVRVVKLRFGIVLSPNGGALKKMLLPFLCGLGGNLGSGKQYMSWIALDDLLHLIYKAIADESFSGTYNAVAPNPVTNGEFTKTLGRALGRWTPFPAPAPVLNTIFGDMAKEALLTSQRAISTRLEESTFSFKFPELKGALDFCLGQSRNF
jgi:uncharacterized protein (TIGR01777 family)